MTAPMGRRYHPLFILATIALVLIAVAAIIGAIRWATAPVGVAMPRFFPGGFFFGWVFFFVFIWIIFGILRWAFWPWHYRRWGYWYGPHGHHGYDDSATEILRQRYARGEITKDQFDQMMRDLESHRPPQTS